MSLLRNRRGFTLIELLVVIAIIAILIGLLLPAVQKVREAAARMKGQNNLKQIAIAVHSYHDANTRFPYNGDPTNNAGCCYGTGARQWSFLARILPYIEQGNLYTQAGMGSYPEPTMGSAAGQAFMATPIKTYLCPSDNSGRDTWNDRANTGALQIGSTNYKGVDGGAWAFGSWAWNPTGIGGNAGLDNGNGIFFRADVVRKLVMTSITDGTSNTLMIGEDLPDRNYHCGWPISNYATGTTAIPLNNNMPPAPNTRTDWPNVYSFRSNHSNGANFAFGDGSTRYINQSVDINTYRFLGTYNGGEVLGNY